MNENTLIAVCGYAGDSKQITNNMPFYLHHERPVLVLSPSDSPIIAKNRSAQAKVLFRTAGKRAYVGQMSLDRQRDHLRIMLEFPHEWILAHDSDSVCVDPKIPDYLYQDKDVLWSNEVSDMMHNRPDPAYPWPRLAFQPPYFMHRSVIEKLLTVADEVRAEPQTPFIDWCMMAWAIAAKVPHKNFPDGVSCPTARYVPGQQAMADGVRNRGATMLHSIKTADVLYQMVSHRIDYKRANKIPSTSTRVLVGLQK